MRLKLTIMKKISIILFGVFVALGANAQNFSFGVKGGINLATISGESANEIYENRTGYHGGLFANLKFNNMGISPEVMLTSQGTKLDIAGIVFTDKMDYFTVPILIKFYPVKYVNIYAGPQFGILISQKRVDSGGNSLTLDRYKNGDLSVAMGVGLELPFGINLGARYNLGVTDVNDNALINSELQNQVYQFSIGFRLIDSGKE